MSGQPFSNTEEGSKDQKTESQRGPSEEIRHVTHESLQPCQQKPKTEMEFSEKGLWRAFLSNGGNSCDIHRRLIRFLIASYQQNHCQLGLKGQRGQNEREL